MGNLLHKNRQLMNMIEDSHKRRLYLLTHGETVDQLNSEWFKESFVDGHIYRPLNDNMPQGLPNRGLVKSWEYDPPITLEASNHAQVIGNALATIGVHFDHVYCSPVYRCVQTATSLCSGYKQDDSTKLRLEPGLYEWMDNSRESKKPQWLTNSEYIAAGFDIDIAYQEEWSYRDLRQILSESFLQFYKRHSSVLNKIINQTDGNILIVTHATSIEACIRLFSGKRLQNQNNLQESLNTIPPCYLTTIEEFRDDVWRVVDLPSLPPAYSTLNWTERIDSTTV